MTLNLIHNQKLKVLCFGLVGKLCVDHLTTKIRLHNTLKSRQHKVQKVATRRQAGYLMTMYKCNILLAAAAAMTLNLGPTDFADN